MTFQTFDSPTSPDQGPPRLKKLREEFDKEDITGFIIPRADAHQGEYVAPADARLAWLTGFTGSAGFCVALKDKAAIFVDGRYTVQIKQQSDMDVFTPVDWPKTQLGPWLKANCSDGDAIAYDPWLHTKGDIDSALKALEGTGITLFAGDNLVDRIWTDRPTPPQGKVEPYPLELSGEKSGDKRARIAETLKKNDERAAVLTLPDSICWLLNIRGSDIERNPVVHAFAILHDDGHVDLFIDPAKLVDMRPDPNITPHGPDAFEGVLKTLQGPVRVDKKTAPIAVSQILEDAEIEISFDDDPCILPKARKNDTEITNTKQAHLRDAHAMIEFLAWVDAQTPGKFSEIDVVRALEGFRRNTNALRDISFDTISGAGPNGAIVHYRVTEETNRTVEDNSLLLVDSGGQYVDGTTDITRTIAIGAPTTEQKRAFTRVLQGMIAISLARWPKGLAGRDLDALARAPLWRDGRDYDHGTGHGVGVYLCVHEGPQRLSRVSEVPLEVGMILSNEPGYYREGEYGIRIENLIVVEPATPPAGADDRDMLSFETLTWVPIDRRLIDTALLSPEEVDWINAYHAEIRSKLTVSGDLAVWLEQATAAL